MRVSVVINTYNRARTLAVTLEALRWQEHSDFEVIVVDGPSDDGTQELLEARRDELRALRFEERHLSRSRNLGIDAAAGEIVAFIDDDAIPEPGFLRDLVAGFEGEAVAGVGGVVLDATAVRPQFRFCACDRLGRQDFDIEPPFDALLEPGADPFLYLTGGNASYRRSALGLIGGFDEEIEYNYEDADVCLRLVDAGLKLRPLDAGRVIHLGAPSHLRREPALSLDPFFGIKNRAYFAILHGRETHGLEAVLQALGDHMRHLRAVAADARVDGRMSLAELDHFHSRLAAGFEQGVRRGLESTPRHRPIATREAGAFLPYALRRPTGPRLRACFVSMDYPPAATGGIPRYTQDLASALAQEGHEIHVVTRDPGEDRVDFENGVWVHRHPEGERHLPELDGHPAGELVKHMGAVQRAVARIDAHAPLDVVSSPLWAAEGLLSAEDPRWTAIVTCMTPMHVVAETQPAIAERPETAWQVRLEAATAAKAGRLHAISRSILGDVHATVPGARDVPADVLPLGVPDRRSSHPRRRDGDDGVEILFVGRLEPRKGVDVLLTAASRLLRGRDDVTLRLIGSDTGFATNGERYADRFQSEHPDLAARVSFEGEVPDDVLFAAYADCDLLCAPSRYESFGLILVEAMSFERPVVACRAGGMPEIVVDEETGLLVPPGDPDALHGALLALVDEPDRRSAMGAAGRRRYEQEFEAGVVARRTADAYSQDLERRAPRPQAAVAERRVLAAATRMLHEQLELTAADASRVAGRLLAPAAFPLDAEAAVRRIAPLEDDEQFVRGLYQALLGRSPEPAALVQYLATLARTGTRIDVVRDVAASDEGRARGLDAQLAGRLTGISPRATITAVQRAWLQDDERFAPALAAALGVDASAEPVEDVIRSAQPEGRRTALLRALDRPEVVARLTSATREALLSARLIEGSELDAEIAAATAGERDTPGFAAALYRVLLDRGIDPSGEAEVARVIREGNTRADAVRLIALSPEALDRGIDPVWSDGLERRIPALTERAGQRRMRDRVRTALPGRPQPQPDPPEPRWAGAETDRLRRELLAHLAGQSAQIDELRVALARERDARERDARAAELAAAEDRAAELAAAEDRAVQRAHEQALLRHQVFGPPERLTIADTAQVNDALFNTVSGRVTVGDNAFFGHGVAVLTGTHDTAKTGEERKTAVPQDGRDVVIGEGAWIASRATVLGPCRIGSHAVVAAGSVVVGDVPAGATVAGVPAKVLRPRDGS